MAAQTQPSGGSHCLLRTLRAFPGQRGGVVCGLRNVLLTPTPIGGVFRFRRLVGASRFHGRRRNNYPIYHPYGVAIMAAQTKLSGGREHYGESEFFGRETAARPSPDHRDQRVKSWPRPPITSATRYRAYVDPTAKERELYCEYLEKLRGSG